MIDPVEITISTDKDAINFERLMAWLGVSYWASARDEATQRQAIAGSMCFSALVDSAFVGFARVVTDGATFAWVCDVMVDPDRRRAGIGKALMAAIMSHPDLQGVRTVLATRDAHELYRQYGFQELAFPGNWMGIGFRMCETPD
jgi:GNAT superfamily N-acetyltransferase